MLTSLHYPIDQCADVLSPDVEYFKPDMRCHGNIEVNCRRRVEGIRIVLMQSEFGLNMRLVIPDASRVVHPEVHHHPVVFMLKIVTMQKISTSVVRKFDKKAYGLARIHKDCILPSSIRW